MRRREFITLIGGGGLLAAYCTRTAACPRSTASATPGLASNGSVPAAELVHCELNSTCRTASVRSVEQFDVRGPG
jgi:hypothetical protein